jgi:hypothetical protein
MIDNQKVVDIIAALQSANSGQEVFQAFRHVPLENLENIRDMINYLIGKKPDERVIEMQEEAQRLMIEGETILEKKYWHGFFDAIMEIEKLI